MRRESAEAPSAPETFFRAMRDSRDPDERATIAAVKRVRERYIADATLREALAERPADGPAILRAAGVEAAVPLARLSPFWDRSLKDDFEAEPGRWPELAAWRRWMADLLTHREMMFEQGRTERASPRFDAWRQRQIARTLGEVGTTARVITHPIVAYELSQGCTVGCWFCAVSAAAFRGAHPYTPDTAAMWRDMLAAMVARFGAAARTGFCYWATDPMDNPDYDKFIEDHARITGWLPQTTTAAPLKDIALTRRVLALAERHVSVVNRFSILTPRLLRAVHEAFTAEELLCVELVIQTRGSLVPKTHAGRLRARRLRRSDAGGPAPATEREIETATSACVSGFLVNLPEGRVRLVAPCLPSDRWPLGYRVYAEARFSDAASYAAALDAMIEDCMDPATDSAAPLGFRADLAYAPEAVDAFTVANAHTRHRVEGRAFLGRLGALLAERRHGAGALIAALVAEEGADVFQVSAVMDELLELGIVETPPGPAPMDAVA